MFLYKEIKGSLGVFCLELTENEINYKQVIGLSEKSSF